MMKKSRNIVLLSTAEWDNPFWTNKQHVTIALAKMGYRILYIDSLGLRKPSVNSSDIKRIIKRLKTAFSSPRQVAPDVYVWSPILLPIGFFSLGRTIRKYIFSKWLNFWINKLGFDNSYLWTYNSLTKNVVETKKFKLLIYHCVDEVKEQPGMNVKLFEESELDLICDSDVIFTTSTKLYETRKKSNPNTYYFSNVSDFEHFNKAVSSSTLIPDDMRSFKGPVVGFIGAISGYKLDFMLIKRVALNLPNINFVFIGKVGEGDPWTDISDLTDVENIFFLGPRNYSELPNYLKAIDVAILPNNINEYTSAMFPMKFFEYLAAGKPVVSVDLDALKDFSDVAFISENIQEFSANILKALTINKNDQDKYLELAKKYTYDSRMKKMMKIVEDLN